MGKIIMGIQLKERKETATNVQHVLTDYGCIIKTRIGLHNEADNGKSCNEDGLIILELINNVKEECEKLKNDLTNIDGVEVKIIEF